MKHHVFYKPLLHGFVPKVKVQEASEPLEGGSFQKEYKKLKTYISLISTKLVAILNIIQVA